MIPSTDIVHLRRASPHFKETERIKLELARLRKERNPFFLTRAELEPIFRWKLIGEYGRVRRLLERNSNATCRIITRAAFEIQESNLDYECRVRLGLLRSLSGIGTPIASAVLALVDPTKYCAIDFRGWRVLFAEDKHSFSIPDYQIYLAEIKKLATELSWLPQEVDLAVWCKYYERINPSTKFR